MTVDAKVGAAPPPLRCGVVLRVEEESCEVLAGGERTVVGYVAGFPSPRTERVSPGHLVALATTPGGTEAVVWRWYDAVVVGEEAGSTRLWEPAHGEVLARPRRPGPPAPPGTRVHLSAGLPGADWWMAGPVTARPEAADVELDEVGRFCAEHGIWSALGHP